MRSPRFGGRPAWPTEAGRECSCRRGPAVAGGTFTRESRAEVVAMVAASGGGVAKGARELNFYDSTLGNWVPRDREEADGA